MTLYRACYDVVEITEDRVFITDLGQGKSVTNDADDVVRRVAQVHGNKRIIYRDTMGRWDELVHERGVFKGFRPYKAEQ